MPIGSPFTTGFRALFERAAFARLATFSGGPPKTSFTVATGMTPPRPVPVAERNPYEVELQRFVDCIQGRADPALLDPIGRSRRCACRSRRSKASRERERVIRSAISPRLR